MPKPKVFISHIKEEKALAEAIKPNPSKDGIGLFELFGDQS